MPEYLRALVYVLVLATPALFICQKIAVPFIDEDEFRRWRNCWIGTTVAVFLSTSFLTFAAIMLLMSIYIHRCAKNPLYFFIILLFAAPCVRVDFGIPGVFNKIVELNSARLLSLLILLPIAVNLWTKAKMHTSTKPFLGFFDLCVGSFFIIMAALSARLGDTNEVLRAIVQLFLDIVLPYFVFSRAIRSTKEVNSALLAFVVAAMPLAAIGFFEMWKHWRVYYVAVQQWEVVLLTPYLLRDDMLRAATTSVSPIAFGFLCMTGAACLVTMRTAPRWSMWHYAGLAVMLAGLYSSLSRGPWLGFTIFAIIVSAVYLKKATKLLAAAVPLVVGAIYFAPPSVLQRFLNLLPFLGTVDKGNEQYRADLLTNSIIVIERYPAFGSHTFLEEPEMLAMIQGQGIIDIVNAYLQIALEFGLVTLFLFLAVFLGLGASLLLKVVKPAAGPAPVNHAGLLALLVAMLFTIATVSNIAVIPYIYWAFAGICAALLRLGSERTIETPAKMRVFSGF